MNWDIVSIVIFYTLIFLFFLRHKKDFTIQAKVFALYKTKLGLNWMNKIAKVAPGLQRFFANVGVIVGFVGMAFILIFLIKETIKLIFVPGTPPALAPVLPGVSIPGAPTLSFWHWVITIFIAAVIHEFSHGVVARLHKIPVKSSGFAFLGPILAAFVEPEEKALQKKSQFTQMSVFAAGPFSNLVLGLILFLLLNFLIAPFTGDFYQGTGMQVNSLVEDAPMAQTGIEAPFLITNINGQDTLEVMDFVHATSSIEPGDEVKLVTDKGEYSIIATQNPENVSRGFFGVSGLTQQSELKEKYSHLENWDAIIQWFQLLLIWLFIINIGIGLFNLLPLGPVDGGRMFYSLMLYITGRKTIANKALGYISLLCLFLIIVNMIPWLTQLFTWLWGGLLFLFSLLI